MCWVCLDGNQLRPPALSRAPRSSLERALPHCRESLCSNGIPHSRAGAAGAMKRALLADERAALEELLRATKRVRALVSELLSADECHRQTVCVHDWERSYSEGVRDNNDYELVCRHCRLRR